ncbi:BREX system Lon protease-like protein BrxL [Gordonia hongkongensis]|uniref:BREX system Lon protease-like protein BrxL n=2 Tax=Gordonia hongkongensis TaxID=1701090 RepID=A0ABT6BVX0_9ACTN|nr:BREX system Lon protease-like protein BrxL [Gordonia hongkongensis]
MVFIGNTSRPVPTMLAHSDLFEVLPASYYDAAYLDRLHCYLPGWEVEIIRRELFTDGYGFVVDYLAEALRHLRTQDFSDAYAPDFVLSDEISTRDRDGVRKTFSGLMKLIHPHRGATGDEVEELLRFAMEGRKRVKDQILRIDRTMDPVRFGYKDSSGSWHSVTTQEELDFPHLYHRTTEESGEAGSDRASTPSTTTSYPAPPDPVAPLRTGALDIPENAMGYSFEGLLIPHLRGAKKIEIVDPYIRAPHQLRNLYDLLVEIIAAKPAEETVAVCPWP